MNKPYAQSPLNDKTDLNPGWVERFLPAPLRPYAYLMRLDRPIGTWLLLLPGWWGLALATTHTPDYARALWLGLLFALGAVVMRGAGCVINDLWDRDFDAMVTRTRTRPLVTGAVKPWQAFALLALLGLIGLWILVQMNLSTIILGFASLPFIILYPLMKRFTWWPQLFLGLTFNFGALMGWAALADGLALAPILLYVAGIFWTLGYDTIYAHMDKQDDAAIGVKSSARALGAYSTPAIAAFYALAALFIIMAAQQIGSSLGLPLGMIAIIAAFIWQVGKLDTENPARCLRLFKFNRDQGLIILVALIIHAVLVA